MRTIASMIESGNARRHEKGKIQRFEKCRNFEHSWTGQAIGSFCVPDGLW